MRNALFKILTETEGNEISHGMMRGMSYPMRWWYLPPNQDHQNQACSQSHCVRRGSDGLPGLEFLDNPQRWCGIGEEIWPAYNYYWHGVHCLSESKTHRDERLENNITADHAGKNKFNKMIHPSIELYQWSFYITRVTKITWEDLPSKEEWPGWKPR